MQKPWQYQRKTNRAVRSDKGQKKPPRSNTHPVYKVPAGETRESFIAAIAQIRTML